MAKDTIVVDLDGTLCNVEHRRHLVQGKHRDYEKFHSLVLKDKCNEWCRTLIANFYNAGYDIQLVSARPKSSETLTRVWLAIHDIKYNQLTLVRPDGDTSPDVELKRAWLKGFDKDSILFTVDDRKRIVDMWRQEGLICLQCDDWEKPKE